MKRLGIGVFALAVAFGSARAADLPVKAPPIVPPAVYSWTGCYVGANGGGLWVRKDWRVTTTQAINGSHDADGGLGGLQAGCNYQTGHFVFGIQGDYGWTDATGSSLDQNITLFQVYDRSHISGVGSVTGRVGYAMDRFLGYVRGGAAWERDSYDTYFGPLTTQPGALISTGTDTRSGWTVGIGGEYAFWVLGNQSLTGFVEYDYYDFGTKTIGLTTIRTGGLTTYDIGERKNVVKAGLNWKFGWGNTAVVAKY